MHPRRRGRATKQIPIESEGQNEEMERSDGEMRKNAERWWIGASHTLEETCTGINWDSFCTALRQEYVPDFYVNARKR
ncbi:hypothetical protein F511_22648 [Dorcoceras hygrometricum]|uniref:Uncharacterized protein n=1 Tax=Dorcoceras hygrometricum TaxID=472368 RepID=A0A2Z7BN55_9LAMI|nr:hypothetical protein F511_22648 [Dorcoceras hygrometricum]